MENRIKNLLAKVQTFISDEDEHATLGLFYDSGEAWQAWIVILNSWGVCKKYGDVGACFCCVESGSYENVISALEVKVNNLQSLHRY